MAEIGRRLVHGSGVLAPAIYLVGIITWEHLQLLLVGVLTVVLVLETARLRIGLDWWIYEHLTREYEAESVAGYAHYMISITGVALVFEPGVAVPAMLMLMIGDPISGALGDGKLRRFKRPRAMVAMFLVSLVIALPFALEALESHGLALVAASGAAALATVADGIKPRVGSIVIDDNLTIPVAGALGLWLAYLVLPTLA